MMHRMHFTLPLALLLAVLCVSTTLALVASHSPSAQAAGNATGATPSPYIWGTNLSLYDQQDVFLSRTDTGEFARRIHVQMVRVPDCGDLGLVEAAATRIKALGMVPLFVLRYGSANLAHDQQLLQRMNRLFGTGTVYYEYGNEMDLARNGAISKEAYTASWNSVVSRLRSFAPHGKFVGPVTYQANPQYVGYFVQHANPRPDAVSWHEYTCGTRDADQVCLSHLDNWTKHIQQTRQAMGRDLPIMITEYNWNANPDANTQQGTAADPRAHNATFLEQWTRRAIGVLVANRVFAANQYVLTNNASLAMIDDRTHTLTGTGLAFQSTYEQDHQPTPHSTPTVTGTTTSSHLLCAGPDAEHDGSEQHASTLVLCPGGRDDGSGEAGGYCGNAVSVALAAPNAHANCEELVVTRPDDAVFPGQGDHHGTANPVLSRAEGGEPFLSLCWTWTLLPPFFFPSGLVRPSTSAMTRDVPTDVVPSGRRSWHAGGR